MNQKKDYFYRMLAYTRKMYKQYDNYFAVTPQDNFLQKIIKGFGRIAVLIIMILLSPVLFIGLSIAIAAVF